MSLKRPRDTMEYTKDHDSFVDEVARREVVRRGSQEEESAAAAALLEASPSKEGGGSGSNLFEGEICRQMLKTEPRRCPRGPSSWPRPEVALRALFPFPHPHPASALRLCRGPPPPPLSDRQSRTDANFDRSREMSER